MKTVIRKSRVKGKQQKSLMYLILRKILFRKIIKDCNKNFKTLNKKPHILISEIQMLMVIVNGKIYKLKLYYKVINAGIRKKELKKVIKVEKLLDLKVERTSIWKKKQFALNKSLKSSIP